MQQQGLGPSPPSSPPHRLTRSATERVWAGVCGGLAEYFDVDPTLMRIIWVAVTIFTHGLGVPAYLLLWLVMPSADRVAGAPPTAPAATPPAAEPSSEQQPDWASWTPTADYHDHHLRHRQRSTGVVLVVLGAVFLASNLGWFNWINIDWHLTWPLVLVAIGIALLAGQGRYWRR
jgi:phage shock protein C